MPLLPLLLPLRGLRCLGPLNQPLTRCGKNKVSFHFVFHKSLQCPCWVFFFFFFFMFASKNWSSTPPPHSLVFPDKERFVCSLRERPMERREKIGRAHRGEANMPSSRCVKGFTFHTTCSRIPRRINPSTSLRGRKWVVFFSKFTIPLAVNISP